jgi:MoxR-like ATPase
MDAVQVRTLVRQRGIVRGEACARLSKEQNVTLLQAYDDGRDWQKMARGMVSGIVTDSSPVKPVAHSNGRSNGHCAVIDKPKTEGFLRRVNEPDNKRVEAVRETVPANDGVKDWRNDPVARQLLDGTIGALKAMGFDASDLVEPKVVTVEKIIEKTAEPAWKTWKSADDSYVRPSYWDEVNDLIDNGEHVLLVGPSGCGKSEFFAQIAQARGLTHYVIDCGVETSASVIIGSRGLEGGKDIFRPGKVCRALQNADGALLEFSELDFVPAEVLSRFHRLFCGGKGGRYAMDVPEAYELGGEVSNAGTFILAMDANTTGRKADRKYAGTGRLNEAFLNRVSIVEVGYENEDVIAHRATGLSLVECKRVQAFATAWRGKLDSYGIPGVFTTRDVIRMAKFMTTGKSLADSAKRVIRGKLTADELVKMGVREGKLENLTV